ncbi:MAG TPA: hypothetical protein VG244_02690 [Acidimicrobiales bacterium]|nr:hypothetical protein [Acidimicrobiales bacterium]
MLQRVRVIGAIAVSLSALVIGGATAASAAPKTVNTVACSAGPTSVVWGGNTVPAPANSMVTLNASGLPKKVTVVLVFGASPISEVTVAPVNGSLQWQQSMSGSGQTGFVYTGPASYQIQSGGGVLCTAGFTITSS